MYTINIGRDNPFLHQRNTVELTLVQALKHVGGVRQIRISQDGDEPTVIIECDFITGSIALLATALDQDCIAVFDHSTNTGTLIGDKAAQWGAFNPEYFQFITAKETA
jgi:hypothetical protein